MNHRSIFHIFEQEHARWAKAQRAVETGIVLNDNHFKSGYSFSESLRGKIIKVSGSLAGLAVVCGETLEQLGVDTHGNDFYFASDEFDLADNPFAFWNRLKSTREVGVMP